MNEELNNIQDLKTAFISHCKELGCDENYIKVCENKFSDIETTLKDFEKINKYNAASGTGKSLEIIEYNLSEDVTSNLSEALEKVRIACLKLAMLELKLGKDRLALKKLKALEIIKNCIVGEFELKDNCDTNNAFNSPYRLRIYINEYEYNEWILQNKEEYDTLKEVLS